MIADYFGLDDGDGTLQTFQSRLFSPLPPPLSITRLITGLNWMNSVCYADFRDEELLLK